MFSYTSNGSFKNTEAFLQKASRFDIRQVLSTYGQMGVDALASATPKDSARAASSWGYEIVTTGRGYELVWTNSDIETGFPVAKMLQIGYGTGTGGYVRGRDYINPAMRPIFDKIAEQVWKAVASA